VLYSFLVYDVTRLDVLGFHWTDFTCASRRNHTEHSHRVLMQLEVPLKGNFSYIYRHQKGQAFNLQEKKSFIFFPSIVLSSNTLQ